jgi:RNA polymerase sigma-70 factor (ECF subfamily)
VCLREARRVLGRTPDAEDAAQEAALRAWRNRGSCHGARQAWLATIGRREALRLAGARAPLPVEHRPEPAVPSHEADLLEALDVRRALAALAPRERALVLGRYWTDLTQAQLAAALDMPEGTAKVRLHRARADLRRALSDR